MVTCIINEHIRNYNKALHYKKIVNWNKLESVLYTYDKARNRDDNKEINEMMRQLHYSYININKELQEFVNKNFKLIFIEKNKNKITKKIMEQIYDMIDEKYNIKDCTINQIHECIRRTVEYNDFKTKLLNRVSRSIILSKHLNDTTTKTFYNNLTQNELEILNNRKSRRNNEVPVHLNLEELLDSTTLHIH
jgi:translation elongation factor EF-G